MAKIAILRCLLVILPPYLNVFMQKKKFIIYRRDARKGSSAYSPKPHSAPHFEGHYVEGMQDRWENYGSRLDAIVDTHDPFTLNDFIQLWKYLNQ